MVNKTAYVNGLSSYEIDSSLFFDFDCALMTFEIVEVYDTINRKKVASVNYASIFSLDQTSGMFTLLKFNQAMDYFITLRCFNGKSWSQPAEAP